MLWLHTQSGGGVQLEDLFLKKLIPHLLLIRSWIPCYPYDTGGTDAAGLNGPGWFLSAMFLYWILTKLMLKLVTAISQQKKKWNVLFVITCCLIILAFGLFAADYIDVVPNAFRPQHILVYLLGLYAGYNCESFQKIENKGWKAVTIVVWTMAVLLVSNVTIVSDTFSQVAGDTLFAIELMYVIPMAIKEEKFECKNILFKHTKTLGDISFEFYLIHMPMVTFLMAINYHLLANPMRGIFIYAIGYAATFLTAEIYKVIAGKVNCE